MMMMMMMMMMMPLCCDEIFRLRSKKSFDKVL